MKSSYTSFSIIILFVLLILCGLPLVSRLNVDLLPSGGGTSLSVDFVWWGTEPKVMEKEVTSVIEAELARIQGVKTISSTSRAGSGHITIDLDKGAKMDVVRFEISTLLRQVWPALPQGVSFPRLSSNYTDQANARPLLSYTLNAPANPYIVQHYADEHIKPILAQIHGLYKTESYGASPLEWVVVYDANKLKSAAIDPKAIENAIFLHLKQDNIGLVKVEQANISSIHRNDELIPLVLSAKDALKRVDEEKYLLRIPIAKRGNRTFFLSDLAEVRHAEEVPSSYYRINGLNTINILIYAAKGENTLVLSQNVKKKIAEIRTSLPNGYQLLLSDDSTEFLSKELNGISVRTLSTFAILLLFIWLITRKWKRALLILIVLLGNLSIAVILYSIFHVEIHLYALAGITVSLGLMTDNIIVMSEHLNTHGNKKVFLAILAGTLSSISSLLVIFFLDERLKSNLVDFALVIIINQAISMMTALFVIPALMDKFGLLSHHSSHPEHQVFLLATGRKYFFIKRLRRLAVFSRIYALIFLISKRFRWIPIGLLILGFGVPIYLLPEKWEGSKWYNKAYNSSFGSEWYTTQAKGWIDVATGGTLRLFTERVFENSNFRPSEETYLSITASLPHGTTITQANRILREMETYLKQFHEIKLFQTRVNARQASIMVYFTKKALDDNVPYLLKSNVVNKAIELGGADWGVYGFGDGFNNSVQETVGNYSICMKGYNYDELCSHAERLSKKLKENFRVKEVIAVGERTWYKPDNTEFVVDIDLQKAVSNNIGLNEIYSLLQQHTVQSNGFASLGTNKGFEAIRLIEKQSVSTDIWQLQALPLKHDSSVYKWGTLNAIKKEIAPSEVCKEDQQYRLYLQFDYIGADEIGQKYTKKVIEEYQQLLPMGYTVEEGNRYYQWGEKDKKQYWLLGLIIVMIFFICSVLFESLLQPLAVILTIPVSYIGIFLTFYFFDLNFDQGGFAALVMLSGITVNAAIYILNDYNNLRREHSGRRISNLKLYFKAFHYKIVPILLTVVSTVLGFVPFLIGEKQAFWFALAAGTIGGLVFSMLGIVFYLPLFLRLKE